MSTHFIAEAATDASAVPVRERYFNRNIQGARGLFALMIFLFHIHSSKLGAPAITLQGAGNSILMTFQFGVELFFCISGFVIAGTLRRARSPLQFLEDRAIRIFPVLWATIPFAILMEYAGGYSTVRNVPIGTFCWYLLANLLCLPPIVPVPLFHYAAWSLSCEMAFYAICTLGWTLRQRGWPVWIAAPAAAGLLFMQPRAVFFLVGLVVAEGMAARWCPKWAARLPLLWLAVFLGSWGYAWQLGTHTGATAWLLGARLPLEFLAVLAAVMFFQGVVDGKGGTRHLLGNPVAQWLGKVSYSFYLWQILVLAVTKRAMFATGLAHGAGIYAQALLLLLSLPVSLAVSLVSQNILEKRLSGLLRQRLHHPLGWILRKSQGAEST